jgi:hypothetical protein
VYHFDTPAPTLLGSFSCSLIVVIKRVGDFNKLLPFRGHGGEESFQFVMVNSRNVSFFSSALSSGKSERFSDRSLGFLKTNACRALDEVV